MASNDSHSNLFRAHSVSDGCGLDIAPFPENNALLTDPIPSIGLLNGLDSTTVGVPSNIPRAELERLLRRAMWAEYDAECLCQELDRRVDSGVLALSPLFSEFERLWRRDELDHALGYVKLYSAVFQVDEAEELNKLRARRGNFSAMDDLLKDEVTILLLVAYDEIATTKSYATDARELFPHFGFAGLVPWIRRLAADESRHYRNCLSVLQTLHRGRADSFPALLDRIVELDKKKLPYAGTFALDHDDDQFPPEMMDRCRDKVLQALRRG